VRNPGEWPRFLGADQRFGQRLPLARPLILGWWCTSCFLDINRGTRGSLYPGVEYIVQGKVKPPEASSQADGSGGAFQLNGVRRRGGRQTLGKWWFLRRCGGLRWRLGSVLCPLSDGSIVQTTDDRPLCLTSTLMMI